MDYEKPLTKIKDLTPEAKQTNVIVKVVSKGERRTIDSRYGGSRQLVEATVGDETGTILLTLWEDQIDQVDTDDTVIVDNGYVSLVRGHMRLNVGKYGSFQKTDQDLGEVNTAVDVSAQEFERPQRYERRSYGFGGSDFGGGRRDRDRGGGGERRERGRRRF